jgi:hypothetical protein
MSCISFYLLCFFFYKIGEQEGRTGSPGGTGGGECGTVGISEEGDDGERDRRMSMVQTMYTHACKCKNDTC